MKSSGDLLKGARNVVEHVKKRSPVILNTLVPEAPSKVDIVNPGYFYT